MMEQRRDYRKLGAAILISLVLHLVIGFSLAAFGSAFTPALPLEEKPVELTLVDLAEPPPQGPKNPPFMETDPAKESQEKPKEETFESNANSIGASERAATGDLPLPSQEGKERPAMDLDTHNYSLPTDGSNPQPQAQTNAEQPPSQPNKPPKTKAPETVPTPIASVPTPAPEQFALKKTTPPPIPASEETEPSP